MNLILYCRIISNSDSSFYLVNPDKDLDRTEKRVIPFINSRFPNWRGLVGISPTKSEFIDALTNYSLLLLVHLKNWFYAYFYFLTILFFCRYCGHGNGTQFLNSSNISDLTILAVPLLFGCSSFKPKNLGGRVSFNNLCHRYIIAGRYLLKRYFVFLIIFLVFIVSLFQSLYVGNSMASYQFRCRLYGCYFIKPLVTRRAIRFTW